MRINHIGEVSRRKREMFKSAILAMASAFVALIVTAGTAGASDAKDCIKARISASDHHGAD